jgi:hypothetical protein
MGGHACAQSNVTISGSLDIGAFRDTAGVKNIGTIQRSHLQFAGTEDLGDGLAATFRLRHRLDLDTGTPEGNGSKPFLLRGPFGAVFRGTRAAQAALMRPLAPVWKLVHVLVVKPKRRQDAGLRSMPFPIFHKLPLFEAPKRQRRRSKVLVGVGFCW